MSTTTDSTSESAPPPPQPLPHHPPIQTSNNTSVHFLGTVPRPWMQLNSNGPTAPAVSTGNAQRRQTSRIRTSTRVLDPLKGTAARPVEILTPPGTPLEEHAQVQPSAAADQQRQRNIPYNSDKANGTAHLGKDKTAVSTSRSQSEQGPSRERGQTLNAPTNVSARPFNHTSLFPQRCQPWSSERNLASSSNNSASAVTVNSALQSALDQHSLIHQRREEPESLYLQDTCDAMDLTSTKPSDVVNTSIVFPPGLRVPILSSSRSTLEDEVQLLTPADTHQNRYQNPPQGLSSACNNPNFLDTSAHQVELGRASSRVHPNSTHFGCDCPLHSVPASSTAQYPHVSVRDKRTLTDTFDAFGPSGMSDHRPTFVNDASHGTKRLRQDGPISDRTTTSPRPGSNFATHELVAPHQFQANDSDQLRVIEHTAPGFAQGGGLNAPRNDLVPTSVAGVPPSRPIITQSQTEKVQRAMAILDRAWREDKIGNAQNKQAMGYHLALLRMACFESDIFYLHLQQIYSLHMLDPQWLVKQLGFGQEESKALANLRQPLWFSARARNPVFCNFPYSRVELLGGSLDKPIFYPFIKLFLRAFEARWEVLRNRACKRGSPPCVAELEMELHYDSPGLHNCLFSFLTNTIFPGRHPQFYQHAERFFVQDRVAHRIRVRPGMLLPSESSILQNNIASFHGQLTALASMPYYQLLPAATPRLPIAADATIPSAAAVAGVPPSAAPNSEVSHTRVRDSMQPAQTLDSRPMPNGTSNFQTNTSQLQSPLTRYHFDARQSMNDPIPSNRASQNPRTLLASQQHQQGGSAVSQGVDVASRSAVTNQTLFRPLLPIGGQPLPILVEVNPRMTALHQAHLRSPVLAHRPPIENKPASSQRSYAFLDELLLHPKIIDSECKYLEWDFEIPPTLMGRRIRIIQPDDPYALNPATRDASSGDILFYLRCVELSNNQESIDESDWVAGPAFWPECGFFSLNGAFIETRRKIHYKRNLPADLDPFLSEGSNKLAFSYYPSPKERGTKFAVGVEIIKVVLHSEACALPTKIDKQTVLSSITSCLHSGNEDDEISMLDARVSIDVHDPFTAKLFVIPVRGPRCLHRECFDLEAFLQSRSTRDDLVTADQWLCPICRKDARPNQLIIDEFLADVGQHLRTGTTDVKAIFVNADGSWHPKVDSGKPNSRPRGTGSVADTKMGGIIDTETQRTADKSLSSVKEPRIIDLEDD